MQTSTSETQSAREAGIAALKAGDHPAARRHFEQLIAAGKADAATFVGLAMACYGLKDRPAAIAAVDKALQADPRNLHALILKGDDLAQQGNTRAATAFYGAAVGLASQVPNLPPGLQETVRRAAELRNQINAHIEQHLRDALAKNGYDPARASPRFTQSLDLLAGTKPRFIQQPRAYFFPELPDIQFYERQSVPWLDAVEAATDDICAELEGVLARSGRFVPYIQSTTDAPMRGGHELLNNPDWSAFFLWKDGAEVPENAAQCPKTLAALKDVPLSRIKGRTPSILFSLLRPGAHIKPHTGFLNTRLICHLPLVVPPGCRFRVGNDEREWVKGKAWAFNDTIEHEAINGGSETRIILIFDVWRPELTEEERRHIATLMEAVDTYPGGPVARWTD